MLIGTGETKVCDSDHYNQDLEYQASTFVNCSAYACLYDSTTVVLVPLLKHVKVNHGAIVYSPVKKLTLQLNRLFIQYLLTVKITLLHFCPAKSA